MAEPVIGEVARLVYEDLAGQTEGDEELDFPLMFFVGALGAMFQEMWDLVQDTDDRDGYEHLLSPTETPAYALSYVAQFAGVPVKDGWSEAETRDALTSPTAYRRGTTNHIVAIVQRFLTGSKQVVVRERAEGNAYHLEIRTRDDESPDGGSVDGDQLIIAAVKAESKPAGILLDFESVSGVDYTELEVDYVTYNAWDASGLTYDELAQEDL